MPTKPNRLRRALRTLVVPATAFVLGVVATTVVGHFTEETIEVHQAAVDASRFKVDLSPGGGCIGSAVGWEERPDVERLRSSDDPIRSAVLLSWQQGTFSSLGLHLSLPVTADKASIDVRGINIKLTKQTGPPPRWELADQGCGGQEYGRLYQGKITDGRVSVEVEDTTRDSETGGVETRREDFEPFSVVPGEAVWMDYDLALCDRETYQVHFVITYVSDTGQKFSQTVPEGRGVIMTGLKPDATYSYEQGMLTASAPGSGAGELPKGC